MESRTFDLGVPVHAVALDAQAGAPADAPTFVLVHGLGGSHVNWIRLAPLLSARGRVFALDLPGFGRTPLGAGSHLAAARALLARFVDRVSPGAPVVLVGNSMGGLLSMMEAAARPTRVAGVVLLGSSLPTAPGPIDREVVLAFAAYTVPWIGERLLAWRAATTSAAESVDETMRLCCVDASRLPRPVIAAHVEMARHRRTLPWSHGAFLAAARSIVGTVLRHGRFVELLRAVRAPTLMLHGTRDRLVPVGAARAAARLRPDWTFVELDGVGHVAQLEAPDEVFAAIEGWLPSLRAEAAA